MKLTSFTNFLAAAFVVSAAAGVAASCQREAIDPDAQTPGQGEEMVIPVSVEGAISVDGTLSATDTKVTVNSTTGVTAWETNDLIGVYVSGTGKNTYVQAAVANNATRLSLSSGESRANYAVYPYSSAYAGGYTSPTVVYPNSYDMFGKDVTSANTWAPTPMVASNANGQDLRFFHVGGLLRLHVTEIPAGTTQLVVTFTGLSNVFGRFTVNNPGTATATTTYSASGTNAVTFTNLSIAGGEAYLNIPVPTKDFSLLTAITVRATGGTDLTTTREVSGWGAVGHGTGKKVDVGFVSITHGAGYTGKFRGKEIAPGYLVWDTAAGEYKLSDPDDPFLPLRYYGITNTTVLNNEVLNIVYHMWGGSGSSLKGRLDGNYSANANITNGVVLDGLVWSVPSQTQWNSIYSGSSSNNVRINSTSTTTTPYSVIRVDLSGATSVGEEGYDYSSKGLNDVNGGAVTANNGGYQVGLLLVPDYTTVTCPGISAGTAISWSALKMFLDGGCVFLPMAGMYNGSSWSGGGSNGFYWSSTYDSSNAYLLRLTPSFVSTGNYNKYNYCPVLLVRE